MSNAAGGEKEAASGFAVTCNLLSQFIKDKGGRPSLGNVIGKNDAYRPLPPKTMSLLPAAPQRAAGFGLLQTPPEKSELTIFYGGKVLVFDKFPADKARDLMMLAGKGSAKNVSFSPPTAAPAPAASGNIPLASLQARPPRPPQAVPSDLPIARKASLHRFLEKRKDRISAKAPYQVVNAEEKKKQQQQQSWLGLSPSLSTSECS